MQYLRKMQPVLIVNYIKICLKMTKSLLQPSLVFSQFLICLSATKALPSHSFTILGIKYAMYVSCSASWQWRITGTLGYIRYSANKNYTNIVFETLLIHTPLHFLHGPVTEILISVRNSKAGRKVKSIYLLSMRHALHFQKHSG